MFPQAREHRPLVSVVMAVLNPHPVYFPQAVDSILQQTLTDWELIIVEDPSAASGAEVVAARRDERIRYFRNERRTSLVEQTNRGLAEARADLVARLDADDIAEPERLQVQVEYLDKHPDIALVGSQIRVIDEHGRQVGFRAYPLRHEQIVRAFHRYNCVAQPSVMFRKEAVFQVGAYQCPHLHPVEDYELWSRMAVNGLRFANLPAPLLRYRVHLQSTKASRLRETLRHTLKVKEMYWLRHMSWFDRARFWGERLLLLLPPRFVLNLFYRTHYRKELSRGLS